MKKLFLLPLFFLLMISAHAQKQSENIKRQAQAMSDAVFQKNYELMADYTYPWVVAQMGGKEKMISMISSAMEEMAAQGATIQEVTLGEPSQVVKAGNELHCILPQKTVLKLPNGTVSNTSSLLCISKDNGTKWSFLDLAQVDEVTLKTIFPDFNTALVIPAKQQPVFLPNGK
ncbi:hypothetical protein [Pontibacter harenae]|uniref:hypothetical protein n=1 Tax=Pontibacter harenae TaxID=2894083 RepID=UPI001E29BD04|nr:hypothetical protein [Pontibacter harenae]MCC9168294.1 hypothetical protein [Pontibacter harenae]